MLYIGIDLHSNRSTYEAINAETGEVSGGHRVSNEELLEKVRALPGPKRVIVEAGRNSWIMRQRLLAVAEEVWIVSPQQVRKQLAGEAKTDRRDARALARLAIEGRLKPLWVADEACVLLRGLTRTRARLVRQRTATQNALRALCAQFGHECGYRNVSGQSAQSFWETLELPSDADWIVRGELEQVAQLSQRIDDLEQRIAQRTAQHPIAPVLRTIGGVGPIICAVLIAEIGDIARFPKPDSLVRYSGLDPSVYQSNNRRVHGPVVPHGNPYLRTAAVQAAQIQHHLKRDSRLRRNYWRMILSRKHHPNVAKLDTARKVLHAVWWVWHKKEAYRPL